MDRCESCGADLEGAAAFCASCGAAVQSVTASVSCPTCGKENRQGSRFCSSCGRPLHGVAPAPSESTTSVWASPRSDETRSAWTALGPLGALIVLVGSAQTWLSLLDIRASGWDLSLFGILFGTSLGGGLRAGAVLLVVAVAGLPLVTRKRLGGHATFILGAFALLVAAAAFARGMLADPRLEPGIGLAVVAVGAIIMIVDDLRAPRVARAVPEYAYATRGPAEPGPTQEYVRSPIEAPPATGPTHADEPQSDDPEREDEAQAVATPNLKRCPQCGREAWGAHCGYCGAQLT